MVPFKSLVRFSVRIPQHHGRIFSRFDTIHERDSQPAALQLDRHTPHVTASQPPSSQTCTARRHRPRLRTARTAKKMIAKAAQKISVFHLRCIRKLHVRGPLDHIVNDEILQRTGSWKLLDSQQNVGFVWLHHIIRLPDHRPALQNALQWTPDAGQLAQTPSPTKTSRRTFLQDLARPTQNHSGKGRIFCIRLITYTLATSRCPIYRCTAEQELSLSQYYWPLMISASVNILFMT